MSSKKKKWNHSYVKGGSITDIEIEKYFTEFLLYAINS